VIEIEIMGWVELENEREIERVTDDVIETTLALEVAAVIETLVATALVAMTVAGCLYYCVAAHYHPMSMVTALSSVISVKVEVALELEGMGSAAAVLEIESMGTNALPCSE
jgi:hypothetical protein